MRFLDVMTDLSFRLHELFCIQYNAAMFFFADLDRLFQTEKKNFSVRDDQIEGPDPAYTLKVPAQSQDLKLALNLRVRF